MQSVMWQVPDDATVTSRRRVRSEQQDFFLAGKVPVHTKGHVSVWMRWNVVTVDACVFHVHGWLENRPFMFNKMHLLHSIYKGFPAMLMLMTLKWCPVLVSFIIPTISPFTTILCRCVVYPSPNIEKNHLRTTWMIFHDYPLQQPIYTWWLILRILSRLYHVISLVYQWEK